MAPLRFSAGIMRRLHMAYRVSKSAFTEATRNWDTHLQEKNLHLFLGNPLYWQG